jgi:hypothetical protein
MHIQVEEDKAFTSVPIVIEHNTKVDFKTTK